MDKLFLLKDIDKFKEVFLLITDTYGVSSLIICYTYPFMPIFFTRIKKISEHHYYRDKLPLKLVWVIFCQFD